MEATAGFDVVVVVTRAAVIDMTSASVDELRWFDRAMDRVRAWADARQAEAQFRLTLPPPLPPDPADPPNVATDPADPANPSGASDPADSSDSSEPADPAGPTAPGPLPLPSLGSQPPAADSPQEALRKARRSRLLADLPGFHTALLELRVTTAHIDLLANTLDRLPETIRVRVLARGDELLRAACACTTDRFPRIIARVVAMAYDDEGIDRARRQRDQSGLRRGTDQTTGMHWLRVDIDPQRGASLFERLDHEREAMFRRGDHTGLNPANVELQALLNLLAGPGAEQRSSTRKAHVSVIVDIETLLHSAHDRTVCETASGVPLPPDTVRNLICDAEIAFGFTLHGRVVHHLANAALATRDQRRELRMMYRTCTGPNCNRPFDHCQIHHVIPRSRAGPTTTPLLVPLCQHCHDNIHHRGWRIAIDDQRTITWTAPDGADHTHPYMPLADHGLPRLFDPDPNAA